MYIGSDSLSASFIRTAYCQTDLCKQYKKIIQSKLLITTIKCLYIHVFVNCSISFPKCTSL